MKKKLYLILPILMIISLVSSAASCSLRPAQDNRRAQDQIVADTNLPVISGIYLDDLNPVDYFFFANETYTVRAEATDPQGDSLTFNWSGDGTIAGKDANPMNWAAPGSEGNYTITVEVTDDKGNTSIMTADIEINLNSAANGSQETIKSAETSKPTETIKSAETSKPTVSNNPPELGPFSFTDTRTNELLIDMTVYDVDGGVEYDVFIDATDPDGDALSYTWTVTDGTISNPSSNPARWAVPFRVGEGSELTPTITVTVDDGKGGTVTKSETTYVTGEYK